MANLVLKCIIFITIYQDQQSIFFNMKENQKLSYVYL